MNQEFRLKSATRTLMALLGGIFMLIGLSMLLFVAADFERMWGMAIVTLLFAGMGLMILRQSIRWKLEIGDYGISVQNWHGHRYFSRDEISGFRRGDKNNLIIRNVDRRKKPLVIPLKTMEGEEALLEWLRRVAVDLDAADYDAEQEAMLADYRHGANEAERMAAYARYGRAVTVLTICSAIVAAFSLIPILRTSDNIIYPAAMIPFIVCGLIVWSKGFIGIDAKKNSERPALFFALLLSTVSAVVAGTSSHSMVNWQPLLPWIAGITAAYAVPFLIVCIRFRPYNKRLVPSGIIVGLLAAAGCAFGLSRHLNFALDYGAMQPYSAKVLRQWTTTGKGSHYHIEVEAVGPLTHSVRENPSREEYNRLPREGGRVTLLTGNGRLGAAWYVMVPGEGSGN